MSQANPEDMQALKLLVEQGLITAMQEERLKTALRHGASLPVAVSQTPMVEAIKLAAIQTQALRMLNVTEERPPGPTGDPIPAMVTRTSGSSDKVKIDPAHDPKLLVELKIQEPVKKNPIDFDDELDLPDGFDGEPTAPFRTAPSAFTLLDQDLDIDMDESLNYPLSPPLDDEADNPNKPPSIASRKLLSMIDQALQSKAEGRAAASRTSIPVPVPSSKQAFPANKLRPHDAPNTYQVSSKPMQEFDLGVDDGITLIADVNQLLAEGIQKERKGLVLDFNKTENNLQLFNEKGDLEVERTIKADHAEKIWARLKVMGRVEQLVAESRHKGICRIEARHVKRRLLIDAERAADGKDVVRLYFASS